MSIKAPMSTTRVRELRDEGKTHAAILRAAVDAGYEFPDAVWKVSYALGLNKQEVEDMQSNYDEGEGQ